MVLTILGFCGKWSTEDWLLIHNMYIYCQQCKEKYHISTWRRLGNSERFQCPGAGCGNVVDIRKTYGF